jgi:hypothetical protein
MSEPRKAGWRHWPIWPRTKRHWFWVFMLAGLGLVYAVLAPCTQERYVIMNKLWLPEADEVRRVYGDPNFYTVHVTFKDQQATVYWQGRLEWRHKVAIHPNTGYDYNAFYVEWEHPLLGKKKVLANDPSTGIGNTLIVLHRCDSIVLDRKEPWPSSWGKWIALPVILPLALYDSLKSRLSCGVRRAWPSPLWPAEVAYVMPP